ncbi:MAG: hypothetical protein JWO78_2499 [Micavibrio sp.]|nr:hypothetical protein [Micavibrio sp.]
MQQKLSVSIFCRVVDNLGDIGVTWRLAQQLVREKDCAVRLVVDDLETFRKIAPEINILKEYQIISGVEVLLWDDGVLAGFYKAERGVGAVIIEAFACALPPFFVELMVQQKAPVPVWIDLEYLSAEDWVEDCHAVVSLHPTGLNKTLFFPGFTARTGGLFREVNLLQERDQFQGSVTEQNEWRARLGFPPVAEKSLDISLFCYKDAPVPALLAGLQGRNARIFALKEIAALLLQHNPGDVQITGFDYMPQQDFERLLWTADVNFVRGEDSFLRALWAGRPYIWQIYTQADGAHYPKLDAFLKRYSENLDPERAEVLADFSGMWNLRGHKTESVTAYFDDLPAFAAFARVRAEEQARQDDLATQLLRFIEDNL